MFSHVGKKDIYFGANRMAPLFSGIKIKSQLRGCGDARFRTRGFTPGSGPTLSFSLLGFGERQELHPGVTFFALVAIYSSNEQSWVALSA